MLCCVIGRSVFMWRYFVVVVTCVAVGFQLWFSNDTVACNVRWTFYVIISAPFSFTGDLNIVVINVNPVAVAVSFSASLCAVM